MGALGTLFADALAPVADVAGVDRTSAPPHEIAPVDVALVCVKSPGTRWAADAAALLLANDGVAVTLQNGLGHLEVLAERLGPDRAAQGATSEGARREAGRVARAEGIPFSDGEAVRGWREVAEATRANRSSMLQDVERGTPTEIDAICGAAAREGERLGVATPLCAAMTTLLA